jgi:hypothetical protein
MQKHAGNQASSLIALPACLPVCLPAEIIRELRGMVAALKPRRSSSGRNLALAHAATTQ